MHISTKYLTLKLSVALCLEAYHCEEEPGQFLYAAMQCLEKRYKDLNEVEPLSDEESQVLGQKEMNLLQTMAKTREELGYSAPA
jgi:hypothetical protein